MRIVDFLLSIFICFNCCTWGAAIAFEEGVPTVDKVPQEILDFLVKTSPPLEEYSVVAFEVEIESLGNHENVISRSNRRFVCAPNFRREQTFSVKLGSGVYSDRFLDFNSNRCFSADASDVDKDFRLAALRVANPCESLKSLALVSQAIDVRYQSSPHICMLGLSLPVGNWLANPPVYFEPALAECDKVELLQNQLESDVLTAQLHFSKSSKTFNGSRLLRGQTVKLVFKKDWGQLPRFVEYENILNSGEPSVVRMYIDATVEAPNRAFPQKVRITQVSNDEEKDLHRLVVTALETDAKKFESSLKWTWPENSIVYVTDGVVSSVPDKKATYWLIGKDGKQIKTIHGAEELAKLCNLPSDAESTDRNGEVVEEVKKEPVQALNYLWYSLISILSVVVVGVSILFILRRGARK